MKKFRFSVAQGVPISYYVEMGADYSAAILVVQGKNPADGIWLDTSLITAVAEGTGIRLSVSGENATTALPENYRVTTSGIEILSGSIYVEQSNPTSGDKFAENVQTIVQSTVTAGDNASVAIVGGKVVVSANLGLSAKIWDTNLNEYVEGTIWIGPVDPAQADPNVGFHAWIDSTSQVA